MQRTRALAVAAASASVVLFGGVAWGAAAGAFSPAKPQAAQLNEVPASSSTPTTASVAPVVVTQYVDMPGTSTTVADDRGRDAAEVEDDTPTTAAVSGPTSTTAPKREDADGVQEADEHATTTTSSSTTMATTSTTTRSGERDGEHHDGGHEDGDHHGDGSGGSDH